MKKIVLLLLATLLLIAQEYPFDMSKLKFFNKNDDISRHSGPVSNQVWISSNTLNNQDLKDLILSKYNFKIYGFDKIFGWLVEFNDNDIDQMKIIESFKINNNINEVINRLYQGSNSKQLMPTDDNTIDNNISFMPMSIPNMQKIFNVETVEQK
ncbi:MAG: hypothetical protein GQ570_04520 [Helicobacteraceae bacterium]|nr:hypothetical protein [Helicobacteraceae bacterium]